MLMSSDQDDRSAAVCEASSPENHTEHRRIEPTDVERKRFYRKIHLVDDEGCWLFVGARHGGYGQFSTGGRCVVAHRVAWTLRHGPIPDGLCVLHQCDVRACVRPSHLFLGTNADNSRDMVEKGRSTAGEKHPSAKLRAADVLKIRRMATAGMPQAEIARRFGMSKQAVNFIVLRRKWKHLAR